jgi:hypothetical protein
VRNIRIGRALFVPGCCLFLPFARLFGAPSVPGVTTSAESSRNHRTGRRRIPARRAREAIAVAGLALLATSATAPAMPVKVPENPLKTVESLPRGRVAEVGPPRVPQPVGLDGTVATIPVRFTGEIPATLLDAYRRASDAVGLAQPGCHLPMELLAAIGKVETNHARGGRVDPDGTTSHPILGPVLDGNGFAAIPDTDGGLLDGDTVWDRAVGPMQFLPGTWRRWQADGNDDHRADPNNVYDASLAAGRYLCAGDRDLATPQGLDGAILSYNSSASYRNLVLGWLAAYTKGAVGVPDDVGGPVPAVLPLPAPAEPTQQAAIAPPTTPAPSTPPPTGAQPPTGEPTPPPAGAPAPPTPVPVTPPQQPATPACETGDVLGGIVNGIVGGLLGPIIGTPELPPCSDVHSTGATTGPTACPPGPQPATTEVIPCQ